MSNYNGTPNVNQTTTIQAMADQLKIHGKLQNFFNVGGIDGQPMLRIAQNVNEMILTRRMAWKFNRVNLGSNNPAVNPSFMMSQQGFQDFKHAGATCFTLINSTTPGGQLPAGGAGVDLNPGVYQNGNAKINYGTFNGGNEFGPLGNWQSYGIQMNMGPGFVFTRLGSDNFTRANENPLSQGGNWLNTPNPLSYSNLQVLSDVCVGTVAASDNLEYYGGVSLPANQYAEITIGAIDAGDAIAVWCRFTPSPVTGYMTLISGTGPATTITLLGASVLGTFTGQVSPGDTIRVYAIGTTIAVQQNGANIITVTDAAYTSGSAAVEMTFGGSASETYVTYFECGSVSSGIPTGTFTVQFLDPHPFLPGNIGTSIFLVQGVVNPAFNSTFVYNQLTQLSGWVNGYQLVAIPDNFHIVLQGNGGQLNSVSSISVSGSTTTVTLGSPNPVPSYPPNFNDTQYGPANTSGAGITIGALMTFAGVGVNNGLNGAVVKILKTTTSSVTFATPPGVTITPGSDTGAIYAAPSGAPGIFNFGWMESASLVDINNPSFPLPVTPIQAVHRIAPEYTSTGDSTDISCEIDYGNGVLKFRLSEPVSTYPFAFNMVYQAKAPKFVSGQSVFQFPDDLSWVIFEMCLWQGMRFAYGFTSPEAQAQMQVAQAALMSALESEDREANEQAITPNWQIMR